MDDHVPEHILETPHPAMGQHDPLWYKDAVIYQLHVKAFCDSNDDGIGDFRGLASKLDYVKDLGVNAVWIMPFYPSPLKDDGYDVADYRNIHPQYGTRLDFRHVRARGAPTRPQGDHRARHEPHLGSAPVVPGVTARSSRIVQAQFLRVERHR